MVKHGYPDDSDGEPRTPSPTTPKKSKSTSTSPSKSKSSPKIAKSELGSGGRKMGPWSKDELHLLYSVVHPKRTGIKWDEISEHIAGRDAKACNNKMRLQYQIIEAIGAMGD